MLTLLLRTKVAHQTPVVGAEIMASPPRVLAAGAIAPMESALCPYLASLDSLSARKSTPRSLLVNQSINIRLLWHDKMRANNSKKTIQFVRKKAGL